MNHASNTENPAYVICSTAEFVSLTANSSVEFSFTRVIRDTYNSTTLLKGVIESRLNLSFPLHEPKDCILLYCKDLNIQSITKVDIYDISNTYCLDEDSKHFYQTVICPSLCSNVFLPLIDCEKIGKNISMRNLTNNIFNEFNFTSEQISELKKTNVNNNTALRNITNFKRECWTFGNSDFSFLADIFTIAVLIKLNEESNDIHVNVAEAANYKRYKGGTNFLPAEHALMSYSEYEEVSFLTDLKTDDSLGKLNKQLKFSNQTNFSFIVFTYIYLKAKNYFMESSHVLKSLKSFYTTVIGYGDFNEEANQALYLLLSHIGFDSLCDDLHTDKPPAIFSISTNESPSLTIATLQKASNQQEDELSKANQLIIEKDSELASANQLNAEKDVELATANQLNAEKDVELATANQLNAEKDAELVTAKQLNAEKDAELATANQLNAEKDAELATAKQLNAEKDAELATANQLNAEKDAELATANQLNAEKDVELATANQLNAEKDVELATVNQLNTDKEAELTQAKERSEKNTVQLTQTNKELIRELSQADDKINKYEMQLTNKDVVSVNQPCDLEPNSLNKIILNISDSKKYTKQTLKDLHNKETDEKQKNILGQVLAQR